MPLQSPPQPAKVWVASFQLAVSVTSEALGVRGRARGINAAAGPGGDGQGVGRQRRRGRVRRVGCTFGQVQPRQIVVARIVQVARHAARQLAVVLQVALEQPAHVHQLAWKRVGQLVQGPPQFAQRPERAQHRRDAPVQAVAGLIQVRHPLRFVHRGRHVAVRDQAGLGGLRRDRAVLTGRRIGGGLGAGDG